MSNKKISFGKEVKTPKKNIKSNLKSKDKYREFDEMKLYNEISKIDKSSFPKYKNPEKWYIKKRKEGLEIIQNFSKQYEFSKHTLYAAIQYSDRILGFMNEINPKEFDLIVIACCSIASKFIENDAFDIDLNEVTLLLKKNKVSAEEIYKSEIYVCQKLNYYLEIPNVYEFIQYLNLIGVFYQGEIKNAKAVSDDIQDITRKTMFSDIAIKYPNEVIAMCIIRAIRKKYKLSEDTMKKILNKYKFSYNNIYEDCYDEILLLIFGEKRDRKSEEENENEKEKKPIKEKKSNLKMNTKNIEDENKENKQLDKNNKKEENNMINNNINNNNNSNNNNLNNNNNSNNNNINNNNNKEIIQKKGRKSIVVDIPKDQNILNFKHSSSSSTSSNLSFSDSSEENKEEEKKVKSNKKNSVHFHEDKNIYFEGRKTTGVKLKTIIGHKEKHRHIKALNSDKINFPFSGDDGNHKEADSPNQNRLNLKNENYDLKKFNSSKDIKGANKLKNNGEKRNNSKAKSAKKSKEKNKNKSSVNFPKVDKKLFDNTSKNK